MNQNAWLELLEKQGPAEMLDAIKCTIAADLFLLKAVEFAGVDWCLARLQECKRKNGKMAAVMDVVLDDIFSEPSAVAKSEGVQ